MYLQFINDMYIQFDSLPRRIRLADGMTRTSLDELTQEELNTLGVFRYTDLTPAYDHNQKRSTGIETFDHATRSFIRELEDIPVSVPTPKQFTPLEYMDLFTDEVLIAIEIAAETDPVLRVLLRKQQSASYILLTDPRTIQGMQLLVAKSLITQTEYDEIMTHAYD